MYHDDIQHIEKRIERFQRFLILCGRNIQNKDFLIFKKEGTCMILRKYICATVFSKIFEGFVLNSCGYLIWPQNVKGCLILLLEMQLRICLR